MLTSGYLTKCLASGWQTLQTRNLNGHLWIQHEQNTVEQNTQGQKESWSCSILLGFALYDVPLQRPQSWRDAASPKPFDVIIYAYYATLVSTNRIVWFELPVLYSFEKNCVQFLNLFWENVCSIDSGQALNSFTDSFDILQHKVIFSLKVKHAVWKSK